MAADTETHLNQLENYVKELRAATAAAAAAGAAEAGAAAEADILNIA